MGILYKSDKQKFIKDCLYASLLRLMQLKNIRDITVTELSLDAGFSRMTFYRNYSNIFEIIEEQLEYNLFGGDLTISDVKNRGVENQLILFFEYLKKNKELIKLIIDNDLSYMILFSINKMVDKFNFIFTGDSNLDKYHKTIVCGIFFSLVTEWTKKNMLDSPDYMSNILYNAIKKIISIA